jgi:hypothetical protein
MVPEHGIYLLLFQHHDFIAGAYLRQHCFGHNPRLAAQVAAVGNAGR